MTQQGTVCKITGIMSTQMDYFYAFYAGCDSLSHQAAVALVRSVLAAQKA